MTTKTPREIEEKLEEIKYNFLNYNGVHTKEYMYDFLVAKPMLALLEEARQEMKEKCLACVPDDMFVGSEYERGQNDSRNEIRNSILSL